MPNVFLTGSRVYGPITENSDIDVVMEKEDALQLLETIKSDKLDFVMLADYGDVSSFKFFIFWFPPINIIVAEDAVDWFKWKYATEKMMEIPPIINREERIEIFHKFQKEGFDIAMKKEGEEFLKSDEYLSRFGRTDRGGFVDVLKNPSNSFVGVDDMWK